MAAKPVEGPTPADAEIVLKLYELRREPVMRASRETLLRWFPGSCDEVAALADFGHEDNAAFRQVTSYFEMAFGLARRGAVHPELLMDWCGEGIFLYAKLEPFLGGVPRASLADRLRQHRVGRRTRRRGARSSSSSAPVSRRAAARPRVRGGRGGARRSRVRPPYAARSPRRRGGADG